MCGAQRFLECDAARFGEVLVTRLVSNYYQQAEARFHSKGLKRQEIYTTALSARARAQQFLFAFFIRAHAAGVLIKVRKQCAEASLSLARSAAPATEQNAPVSIFVCVRSLSSQSGGRAARERAFSSLRQHKINTCPACATREAPRFARCKRRPTFSDFAAVATGVKI
jgi:hypothetical protein